MPGCNHAIKVYSGESEVSDARGRQYDWICSNCLEEGTTYCDQPILGTIRHFVDLKLQKDPNDAYAKGAQARLSERPRPQVRSFWQRLSHPPDETDVPIRVTLERRTEFTQERIEQFRQQMIEYTASHQEEEIIFLEPNQATLIPTREEE